MMRRRRVARTSLALAFFSLIVVSGCQSNRNKTAKGFSVEGVEAGGQGDKNSPGPTVHTEQVTSPPGPDRPVTEVEEKVHSDRAAKAIDRCVSAPPNAAAFHESVRNGSTHVDSSYLLAWVLCQAIAKGNWMECSQLSSLLPESNLESSCVWFHAYWEDLVRADPAHLDCSRDALAHVFHADQYQLSKDKLPVFGGLCQALKTASAKACNGNGIAPDESEVCALLYEKAREFKSLGMEGVRDLPFQTRSGRKHDPLLIRYAVAARASYLPMACEEFFTEVVKKEQCTGAFDWGTLADTARAAARRR